MALGLGSAAVASAGDKVAVWGNNFSGQCVLPKGLKGVKAIAGGGSHSLGLKADGSVIAWGNNNAGQTNVPGGLSNVVSVAAGGQHSLALRADGTVSAWGYRYYGVTNVPTDLSNVVAIAGGDLHSLALKADGTVAFWGSYLVGIETVATNLPAGLSNVIAIAAGSAHNLALKSDGTVVAWGWNSAGQTNVPPGLSNVVAIEAGWSHSMALKADGTVVVWGDGTYGQKEVPADLSEVTAIAAGVDSGLVLKADGSITFWGGRLNGFTNLPTSLTNVTAIASGGSHHLALATGGAPEIIEEPADAGVSYQSNLVLSVTARGFEPLSYRWYFNGSLLTNGGRITGADAASLSISNAQFSDAGQYTLIVSNELGVAQSTGAVVTVISPPIFTLQPVAQTVLAGSNISLTATAIGTPPLSYQWLFNGSPISGAFSPQLALTNLQSLKSGNYSLLARNDYGVTESSNALITVLESAPYIVKQPTNVTAILGGLASFAVEARGTIPFTYQWRFNGADILNATNAVLTLSSLSHDDAGFYSVAVSNSVGVTASAKAELSIRQVAVWGSSIFSQSRVPASATNLIAIAAGSYYLLGLEANETVAAFPGAQSIYFMPTNIPTGLNSVAGIAAGESHCLALKTNGTVVAWGGSSAIIRPPPFTEVNLATNVPAGLSNVAAVAAGDYLSLALKSDGKVVSWGGYSGGTWGGSVVVFTNVPANLSNVTAIAAGGDQALALKSDGRVTAWSYGTKSYGTNVPNGLSNVLAIACSGDLGLALQTNGKVIAWSTIRPTFPPIPPYPVRSLIATNVPASLSNVVAIAAGNAGAIGMALKADGTITTWGYNFLTPLTNSAPAGLSNVVTITAGGGFMSALIGDGTPRITIQPVSQTVTRSTNVRLSARAVGRQPLSYQWQHDGVNLAGVTSGDLVITNLAGNDAGDYRVVVSNPLGSVTSKIATLTIPFSTNLTAALNATNLVWTTTLTNSPWFAQIRETHDGDVAAQSGLVGNNQQSLLQATVTGPGTLRFWWKVSSEPNYDRLWFNMDYQNWATWIDGETDWEQFVFPVPAGVHTLNWSYVNDGSVSAGKDAGWLDEVTFTSAGAMNLAAPQQLSDGSFAFWSRDSNGRELLSLNLAFIDVQASTNLRDWVSLPNACTLTNGALLIRDQNSTNFPMRFYRVIEH